MKSLRQMICKLVNLLGFKVVSLKEFDYILSQDRQFIKIHNKCVDYTSTTDVRMYALYQAVRYIVDANISGDIVECGVYKGGSMMLVAHTLKELNTTNRKLYLYDTFKGMDKPTEGEQAYGNKITSLEVWGEKANKNYNEWCYASLSDVKHNMSLTKYPKENLIFIKGRVEETISKKIPEKIGILRLDTDFYNSTKHELNHLFPLLQKGGVLIIDDYGSHTGSKKACDEYFSDNPVLFNRIDGSARLVIKIK